MAERPTYFAIYGAMRTGSNLLEKTLEALGDTACYGEAFNPGFISGPRKTEVLGFTREERDADPLQFLEQIIRAEPGKTAGFRIFNGHDQRIIDHTLNDPRCARIILRRDPVESYVSLQIARETDQWMLRNPKRRMSAKIRFDPKSFEVYRQGLTVHYDALEARLAANGLSAFRIDYDDLDVRDRLQDVALHIGSTGIVPEEPPILRQNPMPMCEKVENYDEMCAFIGIEPVRPDPKPLASVQDILCPERIPAAFAPIAGPAFAPVIALLHRIDSRHLSGCDELPVAELFGRAELGTLYPRGSPSGCPVFTLVVHPLVRLHAAFVEETCGQNWTHSMIRRALTRDHGPMPPPRGILNGRSGYTGEQHRRHFSAFLEMIAPFASGEDASADQAAWIAQARLVALYHNEIPLAHVFRHEDFAVLANWLSDLTGTPRFPPGQITGLSKAEAQRHLPIEEVQEPAILARVRALHAEDYETFGYDETPDQT